MSVIGPVQSRYREAFTVLFPSVIHLLACIRGLGVLKPRSNGLSQI